MHSRLAILVVFLTCGNAAVLPAQNFRVENTLTSGNKTTKGVTLFVDGTVYDFIGSNGEIIVFDKPLQEIKILEPTLRLQTSIKLEDLKSQIDEMHVAFQRSESPFLNFVARPVFDETGYDTESGLIVFRSLWADYEFATRVFDDETIAAEYYEYNLWLARLNVRLSPAAVSAMVRAGLNEYLARNNRFPEKVSIKLYPKGKNVLSSTTVQADSTHVILKRIADSDQELIKRAKESLESFTKVPFDSYQVELKKKTQPSPKASQP